MTEGRAVVGTSHAPSGIVAEVALLLLAAAVIRCPPANAGRKPTCTVTWSSLPVPLIELPEAEMEHTVLVAMAAELESEREPPSETFSVLLFRLATIWQAAGWPVNVRVTWLISANPAGSSK